MKNYIRKKLPNFQIHRVMSRTKQGQTMMRPIERPYVNDGVPEGCFVVVPTGLLLPKKRRGEQYIVHYTVMNEKIL